MTPEHLIAAIPPSSPLPTDDGLYWLELRPDEDGRSCLVHRTREGGGPQALTPRDLNVRSRVHEYGGGAYWLGDDAVFFSNFWDGRLFRQERGSGAVRAISPHPREPGSLRYADGIVTHDGIVVCVRESHEGTEVANELVAMPADGSRPPTVITSGRDFYAAPRLSPDATQLAFLAWDHPLLPFVGCELWLASFDGGRIADARLVAGGPEESIFQPEWSPHGVLHFATDRSGFWNLHRLTDAGLENLTPIDGEIGHPHWQFASTQYAFLGDGRIACVVTRSGYDRLELLDPRTGELTDAQLPFINYFGWLRSHGMRLVFVAAGEVEGAALYELDASTRDVTTHVPPERALDAGWISRAEPIEFAGAKGETSHAFFYAPTNPDAAAPHDELPPLRVLVHGGPTSAATPSFSPAIQYWTSRGIAVVDVNYGGSTGYGRRYRERLDGEWGVVDVEDSAGAARHLVENGRVDPRRIAIEGGSAGGYTTLMALATSDVFAAGVNHFGVVDLVTFARDTHKFEARYLDLLVGAYPQRHDLYVERSPITHFSRLSRPVLTFQGLDDRVVPPSQSEQLVDALRARGVPFAYLAFEGEGHGFRKGASILRVPEATLYFLSRLFGFEPVDELDSFPTENL